MFAHAHTPTCMCVYIYVDDVFVLNMLCTRIYIYIGYTHTHTHTYTQSHWRIWQFIVVARSLLYGKHATIPEGSGQYVFVDVNLRTVEQSDTQE